MGAVDDAQAWLARIDRAPLGASPLAVDVASLDGRIAKERFAEARERGDADAPARAREALDAYERAFALSRDAYPAVNAATLASLAGDLPRAHARAREALDAIGAPADHWQHASLGEALLILGRTDDARTQYVEAHRLAGDRYGDIASMRRQLRLLATPAALALLDAVPAPQVIAFSGHMIDHPDREACRFPASIEGAVAAALREKIARLGPSIGYAQAACGGDILFLEAMQGAGRQTQIVLPFAPAAFVETSVRFAGESWVGRFERVLAGATRVLVATEEPFLGDDVLFEHAANLIQGMAFLRAHELSTQPLMLTVSEPAAIALLGGTVATVRNWMHRGGRADNIDLAALRGGALPARSARSTAAEKAGTAMPRRSLKSLLFADISGFSKMPEQYAPDFAEMFLGTCKRILDSLEHPAVVAVTQGDGLFLAFDLPSHAAAFAVRLQQALGHVDWRALGLAENTGARVGMHTGPIFRIFDPVTERFTCYGTHVNRTARLEPIAQPGQIFVTEEFAASLIAENQDRYHCDYIGTMQLAKQFGDARLYRLRATMEESS